LFLLRIIFSLNYFTILGDGKIDADDIKSWWNNFKAIMTNTLPSASGFAAGFSLGLKWG
jgi:uncharacterized membrane protein (Fun14 family)